VVVADEASGASRGKEIQEPDADERRWQPEKRDAGRALFPFL